MSDWLGRPVREEEAVDAVALSGWEKEMSGESCALGMRMLREIRDAANGKVADDAWRMYVSKCAESLLRQAEIMIYANRTATVQLLLEALRWKPSLKSVPRTLKILGRIAVPGTIRSTFKSLRKQIRLSRH
jgi:hypothetical protein